MRQEPGKNFAWVVPGPQAQEFTEVPNAGCKQAVNVVAAEAHGAKNIVPLAPVLTACTVTVIKPPPVALGLDAAVVTLLTYFVPEPTETSQPQPPAPIAVPDVAD